MSKKYQPFIQHSRKNNSHGLAEKKRQEHLLPISELLVRRIKVASQSWQCPEIIGTNRKFEQKRNLEEKVGSGFPHLKNIYMRYEKS
jgi:hypothetical protein